ncbi:hypothetical protein DY000_02002459 [Brassica cretica]|uniref:Uncharacterized protein n=1 Tax=Brassica cretica TaxID=69181 RepID=A0ABQ7BXS1_BRACR|nr:hypothetical protein DY000_02002459 [Brassica cretica]
MKGGGGNGGRINGRNKSDAVRPTRTTIDSKLKLVSIIDFEEQLIKNGPRRSIPGFSLV